MPGGESSEEFVEDDSGGEEEEEEEEEGDSSASYESEEESEDDDEDDDGATGDDSDVFETPIKGRKRSRTPSQQQQQQQQQQAEPAAGKNKRKNAAAAATAAATNSSKKKKAAAATAAAASAASAKKVTAGESTTAVGAKGKGKGKGKGAAAAAADHGTSPSQAESSASSSPPGDGSQAAPGGGQGGRGGGGGGGGKGSPATLAPRSAKTTSSGVVRTGGGGAAKPMPAKTPKAAVSDYMQQSNRPYSYINVFDNLRKKIPKAMVQKLLDELVRDGTLNVQEYGKAKIYYANQDALPNGAGDASADKMRRLDEEAKTLTSQLEIVSKQEQQSRSRVSTLSSQPTDAALAEKLDKSAKDLEQAEARNAAAKGEGRSVVAGGMKAAKSEFNKFRALWVDRKRNAMDVVDMIADGMEKKPKAVMDDLGVELDEEPIPAKT